MRRQRPLDCQALAKEIVKSANDARIQTTLTAGRSPPGRGRQRIFFGPLALARLVARTRYVVAGVAVAFALWS